MAGLVRGIAYLHLARHTPIEVPAGIHEDPNRLVDAAPLSAAIHDLSATKGPAAVEALARDMVEAWRRTFPTLARYLRGRPDRCVNLWVSEVYPFLRGDPLAARAEPVERGRVRLVLHDDLPPAFLAALAAAFTQVSGAHATAEPTGAGAVELRYHVQPQDRVVGLLWLLWTLRIPLLVASFVGAAAGVAVAAALAPIDVLRGAVVVLGVVSVQAGASAIHELRRPPAFGPLGPPRPPPWFWVFQASGGYLVGGACGVYLALGAPWVWAFMAAGLVVAFVYPAAQDAGWGPALAGFTYGPLAVAGTVLALHPGASAADVARAATASLPVAFAAAASLFVGDLADRPLDEAGGRRTLAVRLPRSEHLWVYTILLATALATLAGYGLRTGAAAAFLLVPAASAATLAVHVRRHIDDPRRLAPARVGTAAFHVGVAGLLAFYLVQP